MPVLAIDTSGGSRGDKPGIARKRVGHYAGCNEKRSQNRWATQIAIQVEAANVFMSEQGKFLLYTAKEGAVKVEVFFRGETVWLTQKALAELFGVKRPAITKHLGNIFESGELAEASVSSVLEHTAEDGKTYGTKYYSLDAIIAVGYRVNSYQVRKGEYEVYRQRQDAEYVSDFDREIKRLEGTPKAKG